MTAPTPSSLANTVTCKTPTRPLLKKRPASPTSATASFLLWSPNPPQFHPASRSSATFFNHWKFASVVTIGSGRPYDAKVTGDPNQDGNSLNDRLPGLGRNSLVGPAYRTVDSRFSRNFRVTNNAHLSLIIEAFNLFNHLNKRILTDAGGFVVDTTQFVPFFQRSGGNCFPAQYRRSAASNAATSAYAPRQVQVASALHVLTFAPKIRQPHASLHCFHESDRFFLTCNTTLAL
jgi:hypothetical protein